MRVAIGFLRLRFLLAQGVVSLEFLRLLRMPFWALCWWLQCQLATGVWDMFSDEAFPKPENDR
jgi:hypothetical protein